MGLDVIGMGFGRTGTASMKSALETLGFGPCYHMIEVIERPDHTDAWYRMSQGGEFEWSVFDGFRSSVDWPAVRYWREMADHYPSAKVVLSTRDPESWYKSVSETIYGRLKMPVPDDAPVERKRHRAMTRKLVLEDTFGGRFEDKAHAIDVFNKHNDAVRREIAPERLLVYSVKEGWDPLCRFLDVPVPSDEFPRLNDTASFLAWVSEDDT